MRGAARRILLEVTGWLLVAAGVAALVLPGPGLLLLAAGLFVLSQQYEWAERRVDPVLDRALLGAAQGVSSVWKLALSVLFSREEDIYNPLRFMKLSMKWAKIAEAHGNLSDEGKAYVEQFGG